MKKHTTALRTPYYIAADGVGALRTALEIMETDAGLLDRFETLDNALNGLLEYMEANYVWD